MARGGFGVFYDLATLSEVGNIFNGSYPFEGINLTTWPGNLGGTSTFPLSSSEAVPPAITPAQQIAAFDPHLQLPYTLEWNVALEQSLGRQQTVSASYVGSTGKRLIQSAYVYQPTPSFGSVILIGNTASSDYNALQIQFQRRLSHGLQVLASYTWSHSLDDGSPRLIRKCG